MKDSLISSLNFVFILLLFLRWVLLCCPNWLWILVWNSKFWIFLPQPSTRDYMCHNAWLFSLKILYTCLSIQIYISFVYMHLYFTISPSSLSWYGCSYCHLSSGQPHPIWLPKLWFTFLNQWRAFGRPLFLSRRSAPSLRMHAIQELVVLRKGYVGILVVIIVEIIIF
jgi:hypothetical protein